MKVIDCRFGAQSHACRGMWQYIGLNSTGHEVFKCDSDQHVAIAPHVNAYHTCSSECVSVATATAKPTLDLSDEKVAASLAYVADFVAPWWPKS